MEDNYKYLDKCDVHVCQPVTLEEWHEVVLLDDVLQHVDGSLLVEPLVTLSGFSYKILPEVTVTITVNVWCKQRIKNSPKGSVTQIMTEPGHHHTDLVSLVGTARPLLHEVVHHLPGQVHHAQAMLPPAVLGGRVDVVGSAQLSQATQSENILLKC